MSHDLHAADDVAAAATTDRIDALRTLYLLRFAFAIIWAGLLAVTASDLNAVSVVLLLAYPLFDLAAVAFDARSGGAARPRATLYLNAALSLLAAVGLAAAASSGIPDVLRVWGAWAIAAGLVQLVVAIQRKRLGGQLPLVLSGGISTLAGTGFIVMAAGSESSLAGLSGYAALGGFFFLVSALRLRSGRRSRTD